MQERGLEPPTGMRIYSAGRYQLRCYSCDISLRDVSSPVGLIRQVAFVFAISFFGFRLLVVEHPCGVELMRMFGNMVIFHSLRLRYWYVEWDSNPHSRVLKTLASANWATDALFGGRGGIRTHTPV